MSDHRGHVIVGNGSESVLLKKPSRMFLATRAAAVVAALFGAVSILLTVLSPTPSPEVARRIEQLASVQKSLRDLDAYVSEQRSTMERLSADVGRLQQQREVLAQVSQVDREKVEALLQYQAEAQRRREWLSISLSFVIGILSSLAATFLWGLLPRRNVQGPTA